MKKSIPWLISLVLVIWVISKMIPTGRLPGWISTALADFRFWSVDG